MISLSTFHPGARRLRLAFAGLGLTAALPAALVPAALADPGDYGMATLSVSGGRLNVAHIDSTANTIYTINMRGHRNTVTIRQSNRGTVGVVLNQQGRMNQADVAVTGGHAVASITQTDQIQGHGSADTLQRLTANGDYITIYKSGGYGLLDVSSIAPAIGTLGGGRHF